MSWREQAACHGKDQAIFFPAPALGSLTRGVYDEARAICSTCPVTAECLELAISTNSDDGMFGGLSPQQRVPHRRRWLAENGYATNGRPTITHGERKGYQRGCRCSECTCANADYNRRHRSGAA